MARCDRDFYFFIAASWGVSFDANFGRACIATCLGQGIEWLCRRNYVHLFMAVDNANNDRLGFDLGYHLSLQNDDLT